MTDLSKPSKKDEKLSRKANQLPKPQGYKILIALPEPDEKKTEGGIIKSAKSLQDEEVGFDCRNGA